MVAVNLLTGCKCLVSLCDPRNLVDECKMFIQLRTDYKISFIYLQVVPLLLLRQRRRLPHEHGRHHRQPVSLEKN